VKARVVLVSGSRLWRDGKAVRERIKSHNFETELPPILYHGDCDGLDRLAARYAHDLCWEVNRLPGFWHLGKPGGHRRNVALLNCALAFRHAGHLVYVEAFPLPGGRGTQMMIDMVRKSVLAPFLTVTGEE
jgi:hypothetical protein